MQMMAVSRSSLLSLWVAMIMVPVASALAPYTARSLWDMMLPPYADDPFRILEQTPLSVPKAAVDTLALARADWKETATAHVISMDIPGVRREDLKIEVEESRVVRISGEARPEESEGERWHRAERAAGRFWRQFRLPANADMDGIRAHLENGVVRITVPKLAVEKKKEAKVVTIEEGGKFGGEDVTATKAQM